MARSDAIATPAPRNLLLPFIRVSSGRHPAGLSRGLAAARMRPKSHFVIIRSRRFRMALSAEQVAQYHRDGYVCPVPVMRAAEALHLRRQLEAYEATQDGKLQAAQRSRAFLLFKWLDDLIRDPRVLDPIEQLIGADILCWSTIFWIKDGGSKSFVSWHQDNTY